MLTALTETVLHRILFSWRFLQLIQSSIIQQYCPPPHGRNALNWKNRSTFLSLISTGNSISWKHLHCRDTRCYCALPALSYTGSGATACVFRGRCQEMEIK